MLTEPIVLKQLCQQLGDEELVSEFRKYSIKEYALRHKLDADDEKYIECGRRYDALHDELLRRILKK